MPHDYEPLISKSTKPNDSIKKQKKQLKRIQKSNTDYQPIFSKPTTSNDASNIQKKKLKTYQKSDTDPSHTDNKKIVSKPRKMEDVINKIF